MEETSIKEGEYHPAADLAMNWYNAFKIAQPKRYFRIVEALASNALSGNRLAELCTSTINRLEKGEPVSDRYLLGLVWTLRDLFENDES